MTDHRSTPRPAEGPGDRDHEPARTDLAGYVLGGLTVEEQLVVEAHLSVCAECRAELADLDPLPVLLDLAASASPVAAAPTAPPTSAPTDRPVFSPHADAPAVAPTPASPRSSSIDLAASRRARTRRRVLAGGAAVLAVAAALVVGILIARPSEPSFSAPLALHTVAEPGSATPPSGTAQLRATETGTVVRLDLSGLAAPEDAYFECLWTSGQGPQSAGTFRASPDGSAEVDLLTAARLYPGWSLEIVEHPAGGAGSRTVLRADA